MSIRSRLQNRTWTKNPYLISTSTSLLPLPEVNALLASDRLYWVNPVHPESTLREMLENSLCFGVFERKPTTTAAAAAAATVGPSADESESSKPDSDTGPGSDDLAFIGLARCITDFVSFVYLTDVNIIPEKQGAGLGSWLIECVQSVIEEMPDLRRSMLFTRDWERSVPFYRRLMRMEVFGGERAERERVGAAMMSFKGPGNPMS